MDQENAPSIANDDPLPGSSEIDDCKLCLQNVPKFFTAKRIKPKLDELFNEVKFEFKVQKNPQKDTCILVFQDQQDRINFESFIKKEQIYFPKCKKSLRIATVTKRAIETTCNFYSNKKFCTSLAEEQIQDQVTKFWRLSYEDQLVQKKKLATSALSKIAYGHLVEDTIPSPVLTGYRNKCEFTIGLGGEFGNSPIIGYTMGTYGEGNFAVASPSSLLNTHPVMKEFVARFENWIIKNHYEQDQITPLDEKFSVYNRITHSGFWRLLSIRIMDERKMMVLIQVTKIPNSGYSFENLENFCNSFSWTDENNIAFTIESLFVQESTSLSLFIDCSSPIINIYGPTSLPISLMGYKFDVTITAFFQANIQATEKLFTLAGTLLEDSCELNSTEKTCKTLLDLCCGAGAIGISLSKYVDKVVGIELIPDAIENAKKNAMNNGLLEKTSWFAGPVEKLLPEIFQSNLSTKEFIVILDPPRAGVRKEVIATLRSNSLVTKLIYISCQADLAMKNFEDLCRPSSQKFPGYPFTIKRAIPVDLFPHTNHYELLLLFVRESM